MAYRLMIHVVQKLLPNMPQASVAAWGVGSGARAITISTAIVVTMSILGIILFITTVVIIVTLAIVSVLCRFAHINPRSWCVSPFGDGVIHSYTTTINF